jgi:23S rRNA (cytidine1920-2'-O)/16S rRNA (cytidine1409-2'-O)-methyltransferase
VADEQADFVLMVKPQFEVGKGRLGKGGVVRDPLERQQAVLSVTAAAMEHGLGVRGMAASPLPGPAGNVEYFVWFRSGAPAVTSAEVERVVAEGPQ